MQGLGEEIVMQASGEEEMHEWLNSILTQKLILEHIIDDIRF